MLSEVLPVDPEGEVGVEWGGLVARDLEDQVPDLPLDLLPQVRLGGAV
jgi:hypothetical protein